MQSVWEWVDTQPDFFHYWRTVTASYREWNWATTTKASEISSHKGEVLISKETLYQQFWEKSSLRFWSLNDVPRIMLFYHCTRSGEAFEFKLFLKWLNSCFQLEILASGSCFKDGWICKFGASSADPDSPCATFSLPLSLFSLSLSIFNLMVKIGSDLKRNKGNWWSLYFFSKQFLVLATIWKDIRFSGSFTWTPSI